MKRLTNRLILKKELYTVTDIQNDIIIVTPKENGNIENPQKNTAQIEVLNPKKHKIQKGSTVKIALSHQLESIAGVVCLFIPVIASFTVYFLCEPAAKLLNTQFSETLKFIFSLFSFLVSSLIEFFLTRNIKTILSPVIVRVEKF